MNNSIKVQKDLLELLKLLSKIYCTEKCDKILDISHKSYLICQECPFGSKLNRVYKAYS